ncbi:MAG: diguanylate cyclase [Sulfurimonas sp.]|uniref:diguanylate cyclase n=1 Tax=Sulfurimonas sp. TaxID=2022749 RepID=UPI0025E8438C|nr:diguanylate cyclase [Sulfurimonas sp.]MCK9453630.1 diguanylate cyclase [Sulfurimonas sp.]
MKHSIKKIFQNLSFFLLLAVVFAAIGVLVTVEHSNSYAKIESLNNQKRIISSLTSMPKENLDLSLIQFNGKSAQLLNDIDKLRNQYDYSLVEKYVLLNSQEYLADLDKLSLLTKEFNKKAIELYTNKSSNIKEKEEELKKSFDSLFEQINSMIFKNISYNQAKFDIHKNVTYLAFVLIFLVALWYRRRLNAIYKDIEYLYNVDTKGYEPFSQEAGAISMRIRRKPDVSENPKMIDPVTGINNIKGMISSYAEKKNLKEKNFTSVTVIEIDNFSKTNRVYSQELTQTILKKVAFTISLHKQAADVVARTDYNQFTIILSRENKEQSFRDVDIIRQSISELKLASPELGAIKIKLSGGFVIKPNHVLLEESIKQAQKILDYAKESGGDRICQVKDLAHSEL